MRIISLFFLFSYHLFAANDSYYLFQQDLEYTQENFEVKGIKETYDIATHFYKNKSKKLLITVHGYADNCGYMKLIHQKIWKKGYSILCLELPGHGLSSGKRAHIDDMKSYGKILPVILAKYSKEFEKISFLSHSTGALTYLNYRVDKGSYDFEKIILISPLIRSRLWKFTKLFHPVLTLFTQTIPRRSKISAHYKTFNQISKHDPHYISSINLLWFKSLMKWNEEIVNTKKTLSNEIFLYFAENDEVIDTEYNMKTYLRLFPNAKAKIIKGAHHHIDLDPPQVSDIFYRELDSLLE